MSNGNNISQAESPPVPDTDGKDDFTEGIVYTKAIEIATGAKYSSLEELRAARKQISFWDKIKLTWKGQTRVGRIAGTVLDIAELVAPGWAVRMRDLIQSTTQSEQINTTMNDSKPWYKSVTVNSIIVIIALGASQFLGIEITEAGLQDTIEAVGLAIASVTALWGRIRAQTRISSND